MIVSHSINYNPKYFSAMEKNIFFVRPGMVLLALSLSAAIPFLSCGPEAVDEPFPLFQRNNHCKMRNK